MPSAEDKKVIRWVIDFFSSEMEEINLIGVLLAMQDRFGYLPKAGMAKIADMLRLSAANVYAVATFYNQFRFVAPGRYPVKVCMGTACHIKQGAKTLAHWERELGIKEGEVTPDHEYSLDRVACVGCCALAPVTIIGHEVIGNVTPNKVDGILLQHRIRREQEQEKTEGVG